MLINTLILNNFKQYKNATINFPEGLTGLTGRNGAGKSTVFDAITFALFGPLKGVNLAQLKNDNAANSEPVEVELEFSEKNERYLIKRSLRGVNATSKVGLYKIDDSQGETHLSSLGENAGTVSKELFKIIKLDKDSFVNSFFAKQKETAGLLASTSTERQPLIRKMLGFDRLDTISKKAGEKLRTLKYDLEAEATLLLSEEKITELNDSMEAKTVELRELTAQHATLQQSVAGKAAEITSKQKDVKGLRLLQTKHNTVETEMAVLKTKIEEIQESISTVKIEIERLKNLEVEAKNLSSVVEQLENLRITKSEMQIKKDNATLFSNILSSKETSETTLTETKTKISQLNISIALIENAPETLKLKEVEKGGISTAVDLLNSHALDLGKEKAGYESSLKELNKRLKDVLGLDESGKCPECERELGTQKPVLIKKYQTDIADLEAKIKDVTKRYLKVTEELGIRRSELQTCEDEIVELGKTIVQLKNDKEQLSTLQAQLTTTQGNISSAEHDLLAVGPRDFDSDAFKNLGIEIKNAEEQNDKYQKMVGAIATLPNRQKQLTEYEQKLNEAIDKKLLKDKELAGLGFDADILTTSESLLKSKQAEHLELVEESHRVELSLTGVKNDVTNIQETLNTNETRKISFEKNREHFEKYKIFKEIIDNFKTRITSEAIPIISQKANELFVEITKERYSGLHIDKETFDIKVTRDDKEAYIETLSGGEKDLVAVCLRIAISRHIINMSGAGNMGFLALDEVFGSQDEGRRSELMFALSKLSDWFRQVFIVAHNQDVEESFPNRMVISKKGLYSSINCEFAS
ncbi:DNA double-strand break repair ATPase Rad50 [Ignavibacteriales bacterium]